jgi:hypothetical protein
MKYKDTIIIMLLNELSALGFDTVNLDVDAFKELREAIDDLTGDEIAGLYPITYNGATSSMEIALHDSVQL